MAADGLIVLGLDVSQTQAEIQAGLDSILNKTKTKEIILKTAIEKAETEKKIDSVVKSLNKKTVKMGVEVDARSVNNILAAQQKIASTQAKLNAQMKEYRDTASKIGLTLNKDSWNPFSRAVKDGDFAKANEILKSTKKQIEAYNAAVQKMNSDTSVSGSVSSIVEQFSKLKDVSTETQKRVNLLKANLAQFENADNTQKKLSAYKRLQTMIESLSDELRTLSSTEKSQSSDLSIKKKIDDARSSLEVFKTQYEGIGNSAAAQKVTAAIAALDTALKGVDSSVSGGTLAKQWDKVSAAIDNAKRAVAEYNAASKSKKTTSGILEDIKNAETYVKNLNTVYASIGDSAGAEKLKKAISELQTALESIDKTATGNKLSAQWDSVATKIADAKRAVAEYKAEQSAIRSLGERFDDITDKIQTALSNIGNSGLKGTGIDQLTTDLTKLQDKAENVKNHLEIVNPNDAEDLKRLRAEIDGLENAFSNLKDDASSFKDPISAQQLTTNIEKAKQKVAEYAETYSAIKSRPDLVRELNDLQKQAENLSTKTDLKQFNADFEQFNTKVKQAGKHTKLFSDKLKDAFTNFASFLTSSRVIYETFAVINKMIKNVTSLDTAMVELRKVTDATDREFDEFLDNATEKAVELGTTITDLVNATSDFSRLGFSLEDSEKLGQIATVYANVGDEVNSIDEATSSLISTMKGFGLETDDASAILDKFNEVGNNFAITSGGIGSALQRSASSMAAANNTIDETIALITAANTVVQDADVVGTAFKTLSMRIRGATTELEAAGLDMDGMAESTADLREEIKALSGVDIMIDDNTFKSTYKIIEELAAKWKDLTDIQQASITELIAGKRQGNIISAVMENFDIAQDTLKTSLNSAGSAMQEYEVWLDSIEAKTNQFKASFEALSNTLINSNFVKFVLDSGTSILNLITKITDALGSIPTLLTGFAGILGGSGITSLLSPFTMSSDFKVSGSVLKSFKLGNIFSNEIEAVKKYNEAIKDAADLTEVLADGSTRLDKIIKDTMGSASQVTFDYVKAQNGAAIATQGLTGKLIANKAASLAAAAGQALLNAAWTMGISLIITGLVSGIQWLINREQELIDKSNEVREAFQEFKTTNEDNVKTLKSLEDEFNTLSEGVGKNGENISLSVDDYNRYKEIVETIIDISPELIKSYDIENGYLADKNELLKRAIELQEQEYQAKLKSTTTTENLSTALAGSVSTYSKLKSGATLTSDTDLSNAVWRMFNVNDRDDIPKDMESGEFLARQIMEALGVENVDAELEKYFNEYGYWQNSWFWDDYVEKIADDLSNSTSKLASSIDYESAGFESSDALLEAVEVAKDAAVSYGDVQSNLAQTNKDVSDQLKLVAESNDQYASLSDDAKKVIDNFVESFGIEDITKDKWFGGKKIDEDALNSVKAQINDFVSKFTPELQEIIDTGFALQVGLDFEGNKLSVKDYQEQVKDLIDDVNNIEDEEIKVYVQTTLGIDDDSTSFDNEIEKAISHVNNLLNGQLYDDNITQLYEKYKSDLEKAAQVGVDFTDTVYGNIDTNSRQLLDWTEENLEKYKDALQSWEDESKTWDDIYNEYFGSYSTVDGRSEEFGGIEIAFTPILQTENGAEYLSSDTVRNYIEQLISKANADGSWTDEELLALDAAGIEQDGRIIKNMIAGIGDEAIKAGQAMHYVGEVGSVADNYKKLEEAANAAGHSVEDVISAIENGKSIEDMIGDFTVDEVLEIYYNISAEPNSMSFDELKREIWLLGVDWSKTVDVWDFSTLTDGLSDIESSVTSLVGAMEKLKAGTKLTTSELAQLALQYPDLMKQSDLFKDTTIDNQKTMLDAILSSYESEYDALLETKIAELTATNQLIKDQVALENEKKNKVIEIADLQSNGKLESEADYQKLLLELQDLEGKNFVTYSDGVLDVNEDMLNKMLEQQGDEVDSSKPIWGALGDMIIEANSKGLSGALNKYPQFLTSLKNWASTSLKTVLSNIGTNISKAFSGDKDFVDIFSGVNNIGSIVSSNVTLETAVESEYKIDDKSVDAWAAEYKDVIDKRVETLTEQISANEVIIDNLKKLKGLDLKSIYNDTSTSKDSSSKVKEYVADIDEFYEALKRLESIQIRLAALESEIEYADTEEEKILLTRQLVDLYKEEADALEHLNQLRTDTIQNGIDELQSLGFNVNYDADANEFVITNLEHLNELQATTAGEYKTLQEATNAFRQDTETLIDTLEELNTANQEGDSSLLGLRDSIKQAREQIIEYLDSIIEAANESVDSIQGVYDTLKDAAQEYADSGHITVDTLQKIYDLGVQNLAYLSDENGQLVINEENIRKVIAARTEQLALENALVYVAKLREAMSSDNPVEDMNALLYATTETANATWDLVYAQLEYLGLSDSQYNAALQRINTLRSLADTAVTSIGKIDNSAKDALESTANALEDLLGYVQDMIQHEVESQIDALEDQIDKYREIVDLQKESLDLEREKDQYNKNVAEKTKSIAELQARIALLNLDDSREAQAEKAKLSEELAELNNDLAETQADHAYSVTSDALDAMADAYEEEKKDEIEILENSISSQEKLYKAAIARIESEGSNLKNTLIAWNEEYGNSLTSEIETAWNNAKNALREYQYEYERAVQATNNAIDSSSSNIIGTMGEYDTSGSVTKGKVKEIVAQMKANSKQHGSEDAAGQLRLNKENLRLGEELQKLIGRTVVRGNDGVWYLDKVGGAQLYSTYPYSTYHTGGIVGDKPTTEQDEMFALLEKGEAVLTEPQQKVVYRVLDASETLASKLGINGLYRNMNGSGYAEAQSHNAVMRDMQQAQAASGGSHVSQSIGDVTVPVHVMVTEKIDKSDIKRLSREIGDVASQEIYESFVRGGTTTLKGRMLRPK